MEKIPLLAYRRIPKGLLTTQSLEARGNPRVAPRPSHVVRSKWQKRGEAEIIVKLDGLSSSPPIKGEDRLEEKYSEEPMDDSLRSGNFPAWEWYEQKEDQFRVSTHCLMKR